MKYKCPSCKLLWEDSTHPLEQVSTPLCIFCSTRHTEKQLLNWQMDHINEIDPKDITLVLKYFYRYVERMLKELQDKVYAKEEEK